jgi:hypothetical protein
MRPFINSQCVLTSKPTLTRMVVQSSENDERPVAATEMYYLNSNQLAILYDSSRLEQLSGSRTKPGHETAVERWSRPVISFPSITETQIQAMSKGDAFVKGAAIFQTVWLFITLCVRWSKRLPAIQLELAVLAFSLCSFTAYVCHWSKPQDVKIATILPIQNTLPKELLDVLSSKITRPFLLDLVGFQSQSKLTDPIPNDAVSDRFEDSKATKVFLIVFIMAGTVFASVHCIAWNFHFPTPIERTLWRCACIISTLMPLVWCVVVTIMANLSGTFKSLRNPILGLNAFLLIGYFVSRLFLMVEIFRSLCVLPPEAFVATWSSGIPHIS